MCGQQLQFQFTYLPTSSQLRRLIVCPNANQRDTFWACGSIKQYFKYILNYDSIQTLNPHIPPPKTTQPTLPPMITPPPITMPPHIFMLPLVALLQHGGQLLELSGVHQPMCIFLRHCLQLPFQCFVLSLQLFWEGEKEVYDQEGLGGGGGGSIKLKRYRRKINMKVDTKLQHTFRVWWSGMKDC